MPASGATSRPRSAIVGRVALGALKQPPGRFPLGTGQAVGGIEFLGHPNLSDFGLGPWFPGRHQSLHRFAAAHPDSACSGEVISSLRGLASKRSRPSSAFRRGFARFVDNLIFPTGLNLMPASGGGLTVGGSEWQGPGGGARDALEDTRRGFRQDGRPCPAAGRVRREQGGREAVRQRLKLGD